MLRLLSWLALLATLSRPPDMEGKATFYGEGVDNKVVL